MEELTVKPWRVPGKDRLYVNLAGVRGKAVAWLDCPTGAVTITDDAFEAAALAKIREWVGSCGRRIPPLTITGRPAAPAEPPIASPPPLPPAAIPPLAPLSDADDLARNQPGTGVRSMIRTEEAQRNWLVRAAAKLTRENLARRELVTGLHGEQLVGGLLNSLRGSGWYVLHGVPLPSGADIDHVVIGPPGVFTVNTKHHPDASVLVGDKRVLVNRNSFPYLANAEFEGRRTAALLTSWCGFDVPVQPVVAVVGARKLTHSGRPAVAVLAGEQIIAALSAHPPVLTPTRVDAVFTVARRRSVWAHVGRRPPRS
ncbi:nuclease-related domain-containing protein [Kitasatospora sp. NPDC049258]|uniref:nuclease-related domain-containing protein n=1 Tax=Kitasatospora sp. NPDC049258 TaxID=3155394 RepID=UPI00343D3FDD